MEPASTSPIAMSPIASAVFTPNLIVMELRALLCMGALAIAWINRTTTTPSRAIIFLVDLALVKCLVVKLHTKELKWRVKW
jgi:hypothetical protein